MGDFFDTILSFPTVVFTALLLVVVGYWILVVAGGLDSDADGGLGDVLDRLGLGGTPATVVLSIAVAAAWFTSLVASVLFDDLGLGGAPAIVLGVGVLLLSAAIGTAFVHQLRKPLRRLFPDAPEASRHHFVGRECVIRTGRVDTDFGQAEVHAADGSSAIVQVRQTGADTFTAGSRAVIYDYDTAGEFFWVVPADLSDRSKDR